tara:strand:+ start:18207 stop:18314 length:108 start_codon:yes stop_codon:yes gene_type:complete
LHVSSLAKYIVKIGKVPQPKDGWGKGGNPPTDPIK